MDRAKLKGYGAFALVFVLGMLIGGAGSRAMLQRRYARLFRDRFAVFEHRRLGALSRRLSLDDAQEDKVRAIMSKYGEQRRALTRDIMDRCGAPLRAQKAQMDAEIRSQLRAEQQSRYDLLVRDSNGHASVGDAGPLEPLP
jgi:hypothetical protein